MKQESYDLVIIGSGPAGIHAAVQAAKLGKRVAVIEKSNSRLGGTWIHTGTIPSKTLRETLATIHSIRFHCGSQWVDRLVKDLSASKVFGRAMAVAGEEENVVREYIKRNRISLLQGYGKIVSRNSVQITPSEGAAYSVDASFILIATGSQPRRPSEVPFDKWRIVDSDEVLNIESVPRTMVIYGAGVIGCEYACIFNALGTKVTIVDAREVVMQNLDRETTNELKSIMEHDGIEFVMNKSFVSVQANGPTATAIFSDGYTTTSEVFFFAAGRVSTTQNLGLEDVGVKFAERGAVAVNEHFQTNLSNIYAVGDAIGAPALAATSAEQGRYASCHAFNKNSRDFPKKYPVGIYTIPEMSSVGKTEEELQAENISYEVGRAQFAEIARGYIRGDTKGLLKLLVCKNTQKILGIHIVGPDACNLIHTGLVFMLYDGPAQDIVDRMIFNYPTLAETYRIAAFNALNKIFADGDFKPVQNDSQTATKLRKTS